MVKFDLTSAYSPNCRCFLQQNISLYIQQIWGWVSPKVLFLWIFQFVWNINVPQDSEFIYKSFCLMINYRFNDHVWLVLQKLHSPDCSNLTCIFFSIYFFPLMIISTTKAKQEPAKPVARSISIPPISLNLERKAIYITIALQPFNDWHPADNDTSLKLCVRLPSTLCDSCNCCHVWHSVLFLTFLWKRLPMKPISWEAKINLLISLVYGLSFCKASRLGMDSQTNVKLKYSLGLALQMATEDRCLSWCSSYICQYR